jgi:hypothetical protein
VDIAFAPPGPTFGDLFPVCGSEHPSFPSSGTYAFQSLANLGFTQVDDFFGIRSEDGVGDDVVIWLYPLIKGRSVYHHEGPFDGIRLNFNVLRNPVDRADLFYRCIESFAGLGTRITYASRNLDLAKPPDLRPVKADVAAIVEHWRDQGVEVGSDDALEIDY